MQSNWCWLIPSWLVLVVLLLPQPAVKKRPVIAATAMSRRGSTLGGRKGIHMETLLGGDVP